LIRLFDINYITNYINIGNLCYNITNRTPQASAAFWQYAEREGA